VLHLVVVNKKRKEKKGNINNNLANLPSHDKRYIHYQEKKERRYRHSWRTN